MAHLRPALARRLTRRTCLACGHQGSALQGAAGLTTRACPSCGADLCARPPRSYAEMEGMVEIADVRERWAARRRPADTAPVSQPIRTPRDPARSLRWALVCLLAAMGCAAAAWFVF